MTSEITNQQSSTLQLPITPAQTASVSQNDQNKPPDDDDDDEDEDDGECLVIDLDKSTLTHNNVLVAEFDEDKKPEQHPDAPKSSISITKREPSKLD